MREHLMTWRGPQPFPDRSHMTTCAGNVNALDEKALSRAHRALKW